MPLTARMFQGDEELGKKDDDHRPGHRRSRSSISRVWKGPRRRRLLFGVLGFYLLYLFFKNIPTDLPRIPNPRLPYAPSGGNTAPLNRQPPKGPPPKDLQPPDAENHYFDGPIKFYLLAATLHSSFGFPGSHPDTRNVLFTASSLKSASSLIPMACEMAIYGRNNVHFALMGRDDIPISMVKKINGVTDAECPMGWHDARPDYSQYSTDFRMEISTRAALGHINAFMNAKAIITDDANREDGFFLNAIEDKASNLGIPVIEMPSEGRENLKWLAKLDSLSLRAWNDIEIEILIHAQTGSSGSLIRLLKSIENADYFGSEVPGITIELPTDVDLPTLRYLEALRWPRHKAGQVSKNKVTIRHRLQPKGLTAAEASIRTVESFFPKNPGSSHVLLINPQAELSPTYFHYLKYTLLEYKHSASAHSFSTTNLLGISLDLPSTTLDEKSPLVLSNSKNQDLGRPSLVLYEAPNSNAALYFGDKWTEFHSFITNRFAAQQRYKKPAVRPKAVTEKSPAWIEYLVELVRARGYTMLLPSFVSNPESALVTIHNELYQIPEEFMHPELKTTPPTDNEDAAAAAAPGDIPPVDPAEYPFTADPAQAPPSSTPHDTEASLANRASNIINLLGYEDDEVLPDLLSVPLLSPDGTRTTPSAMEAAVESYKNEFRVQLGGCVDRKTRWVERVPLKSDDLFCLAD